MCELLALSSSSPARLTFSLQTLAARGGAAGSSNDGWGVAFYQGTDVALFREPSAAADSALVRFLETGGPATSLAISRIRHGHSGRRFALCPSFAKFLPCDISGAGPALQVHPQAGQPVSDEPRQEATMVHAFGYSAAPGCLIR